MAEIRVGLIGYGNWARQAYVPALQRDGRAQIVAGAARTEATRDRIRAELGNGVAVFDSGLNLLEAAKLDAVMIAVPDEVHEETLMAALNAGVAVCYEPPVAVKRDLVRPALARLLAAPQITHANLELGFVPAVVRSAEIVNSGVIGQPRTTSIRLQCNWGPWPDLDLCAIDQLAPWYVDVLNRLLDSLPHRVLVIDGRGTAGRAQNQSTGIFDYDGIWGALQANITSVVEVEATIEINGDDGDLVADVLRGELRLRSRNRADWSVESVLAIQPHAGWPGMHECVSAFLDAVETGKASAMDADVVARLHLIGLAAEASVDSGTWAEVESLDSLKRPGSKPGRTHEDSSRRACE